MATVIFKCVFLAELFVTIRVARHSDLFVVVLVGARRGSEIPTDAYSVSVLICMINLSPQLPLAVSVSNISSSSLFRSPLRWRKDA